MTSSITDRWEVYATTYRFGNASREPLGEFLAQYFSPTGRHYAPDNFLDAAPGTQRDYSNIGAALAGYIVERVQGQSLPRHTRTHIFAPLGMTSTGWTAEEIAPENLSTQFVSQNGMAIPIQQYTSTTYPDGALLTSVADLSKFFIAMLTDGSHEGTRILDATHAAAMVRFQFHDGNRPENFPPEDGNSGLFWRTRMNGALVGFGGNDPGVQAEMLATVARDVGVILLSNTSLGGADQRAFGAISDAIWKRAEGLR
jgi:CubicO group peptidase (beta-lactamase class C family)